MTASHRAEDGDADQQPEPRPLRLVSITGSGPHRPHLFMNPLSDGDFAERTTELVRGGGVERPEELADQLRTAYPDVVARKREIEGEAESWYVYRDGHWVDDDPG